MADLSALGNLQTSDPLDLPLYVTTTQRVWPFPKAGSYIARTPEEFPASSFSAANSGFLLVDVSPTLVGGEYDGYRVNFTKVSAKTWKNKDGITESQVGRYLKACGINDVIDGNPQAQADLIATTANTLIEVDLDWVLRKHGYELRGMKNFPLGPDGQPSRFVSFDGKDGRPDVKDPNSGLALVVRAYVEVIRFRQIAQ